MAAREGVGAARKRQLHIGCKRVTSVEVNRICEKFVKRSRLSEESGQGWPAASQRDLRQTKQLGVIWSSRTAH